MISATGVKSTVNHMLPPIYAQSPWGKSVTKHKNSPAYLVMHLGFKGDIRNAGAKKANKWFFSEFTTNLEPWDIFSTKPDKDINCLYVSFPSLKDPDHVKGPELMETGECVTFVEWDNFE